MTQRVSGSYHCCGIGVLSVGGGDGDRVGSLAGGMTASAGSGGGDPRSDLPGGRESWRLCALDDLRDVPRDPCRAERLAAASFAAARAASGMFGSAGERANGMWEDVRFLADRIFWPTKTYSTS